MAFALTQEQRAFMATTRELARTEFAPLAEAEEEGRVNRPLVQSLGRNGLLQRLFPARALELCLLREALALECVEAETALALQGLGAYPIFLAGRPALAERWIPLVARGEAIAAFALTESKAGSDAAALELRAERDGDGFRLTGAKKWISNAPDADVYTVFARTSEERSKGITAFVVAGDAKGVSGSRLKLVSPHPVGTVELDGVFVTADDVLGEVGRGFRVAMATLDLFRPSVGAFAVGIAESAIELALAHAATREAFGRPLREFQAVSHQLAEMATTTEAARHLVYAAAQSVDDGATGMTKSSAMAKLFATETAQKVVDAAIQIHGAVALEEGHPLERLYREVRAPRIYEGTSEIQREVIARELFRAR